MVTVDLRKNKLHLQKRLLSHPIYNLYYFWKQIVGPDQTETNGNRPLSFYGNTEMFFGKIKSRKWKIFFARKGKKNNQLNKRMKRIDK